MALFRLLLSRLLGAAGLLLAVSVLIFVMVDTLPGDVAMRILGRAPDPERLAILRERLGLDVPIWDRYLRWLSGVLRGDFGVSLVSGQPVSEIVGGRLVNSLILAGVALALYVPIAVLPAIVQATHRDQPVDHLLSAISLMLLSIPDFLLATILLIVFAGLVPLAPARSMIDAAMPWSDVLGAVALPAITIALVMGTYALRYLRDSLIEVLSSDYVRMARLNGMPERRVLWRHAIPNALIPAINITSLNLTYLFGGAVVVEQVFAFPGFGALIVSSLMQLDIPVIQACILIAAGVYVAGNLAADLTAMALNPRLRHAG